MSGEHGHSGHGHIAPPSLYYKVFGALIVGTILTVAAAMVDMGPLNNIVMLVIACTKASQALIPVCQEGRTR